MEGKSIRTKEEKARIVMEALSGGTSIAEICRRYNIASSAFYKWRDGVSCTPRYPFLGDQSSP